MNLILLEQADFLSAGRVRISGRRREHVLKVHRAEVGDAFKVGRIDGPIGRGVVIAIDDQSVTLDVVLDGAPPGALPLTLVLALPRPPVLRRALIAVASLGVKRIVLVGARAVEKSFWQSHAVGPDSLREQSVLGLEQGCDTILPEVLIRRRFESFARDDLPGWVEGADAFVAHPTPEISWPERRAGRPALLAIGPEGGWSDHELEALLVAGLHPISLGPRPLRVETAIPALIARLL